MENAVIPDHVELITCQRPMHGDDAPVAHWRLWTEYTVNHFCTDCVMLEDMILKSLEEGWKLQACWNGWLKTGQLTYRFEPDH